MAALYFIVMADIYKVLTGVGSIASPAAAIGDSLIQSRQNRLNREWTEQQNDLAWQRQNQLINEQRAYDTPKEQMKRLMDAGLNPNLIYGDLGGNMQAQSAPNAAGSYQGVAPQVDPLALSQSLLNMANARRADAQTANETELTKAKIKEIYGETNPSKATISYLLSSAAAADASGQKTLKEIDLISAQIDFTNEEKRSKFIENNFNEQTFNTRKELIESELKISKTNAEKLAEVLDATIKQMLGAANASNSSAALSRAQIPVQQALIDYYSSASDKNSADAAYVRLQHVLEDTYGEDIRAGQVLQLIGNMYESGFEGSHKSEIKFYTSDKNRIKQAHPRKSYKPIVPKN